MEPRELTPDERLVAGVRILVEAAEELARQDAESGQVAA